MEYATYTPQAEIKGAQLADALYAQKLETADTIDGIRRELDELMSGVGAEGETGERLTEIKEGLNRATESGHGDVVLRDQIDSDDHILGQHTFDSGMAEVRRDQFTPETITADTRKKTLAVVVEEDKEGVGHRGQDPEARANVIYEGQMRGISTALEGEVGANIERDLGKRTDVPQEVYQEGEEMVADLGAEEVSSYVRIGGANQGRHMQELVWERQDDVTLDQMIEEGRAVGMKDQEIVEAAQQQGKFDPARMPTVLAA